MLLTYNKLLHEEKDFDQSILKVSDVGICQIRVVFQKFEGKTTTLKFCLKVVKSSFQFSHLYMILLNFEHIQ